MIYAAKDLGKGAKQSQESPKKDQKIQIYTSLGKWLLKDFCLYK